MARIACSTSSKPGRIAYLHLIRGTLSANGVALKGGDALKITDEKAIVVDAAHDAEFLLFDLPAF